jgi:hypothetical protein
MDDPDVSIVSYPGERAVLHGTIGSFGPRNRISGVSIVGVSASDTIKIYSTDLTIENSDISGDSVSTCVMVGSPAGGLALRPVIRRNVFHGCGNPAHNNLDHAIYASYTEGGRVTENLFFNQSGYAIQLYPNAQTMVFSHNVIDGGGVSVRGGVVFGSETSGTPSSNNIVEFNVIAFAASLNITTSWGGTPGTGNIARNNCVWGGAGGDIGPEVGFTSIGNLIADPQFADRGSHDYRLLPWSGCLPMVGYDTAALLR